MNSNLILFDDASRDDLLPLTFTRPVADLRIGIDTIREKWQDYTGLQASCLTVSYLSRKFPVKYGNDNLYINASIIPDSELVASILKLKNDESLKNNDKLIALRTGAKLSFDLLLKKRALNEIVYEKDLTIITYPWDLFSLNDNVLRNDFTRVTKGKKSNILSSTNRILGGELFVEDGVNCECAVINTTFGPVYLGKNAEVMEGTVIRGPLALGEHSALKMNAKVYGATTIGPHCKVGGEIHNSIFTGFSSKAHDGFLGNAVIGEWCNLGADTNNSNLKNNYAKVKMWNYTQERFINTNLQFCGLVMGDHSKCGINTMFNTGTVVGVSANIFGAGFPRNFVPSFSWGGPGGYMVYKPEKALETAAIAMKRRNIELNEVDKELFYTLFELTNKNRNF